MSAGQLDAELNQRLQALRGSVFPQIGLFISMVFQPQPACAPLLSSFLSASTIPTVPCAAPTFCRSPRPGPSAQGGGVLVTKSCLTLATLSAVACQAPLFMGFSRQEHWSGLSFPSPGDLPNPGIKPGSPTLQAESLPTEL